MDVANLTKIDKNKPFFFDFNLTRAVVFCLLVVTVTFGVTLVTTLHSIVSYQENSAKYINISGQQRMLSQRLALFSLMYIDSANQEHQIQAQLALDKIKSNLNYLLDESREDVMMSDTLFAMYYRPPLAVRSSLLSYLAAIERIISVPAESIYNHDLEQEKQYILANVTPMLFKLDSVVQQYEAESIEKVESLKTLEYVLLISFLMCSLVILFVFVIPWLRKNREKHARLHAEASTDHLTNLLNRKALSELDEIIFDECNKNKTSLSALMIDIDYFKQVNDRYGHAMGDKVLVDISKLVCSGLRERDFCFRYGGEEFLIILPDTNSKDAMIVAEKIQQQVANTCITKDELELNVTLSIGVSAKEDHDNNLSEVIERSDIAMYRAKNQGRDRIVYC